MDLIMQKYLFFILIQLQCFCNIIYEVGFQQVTPPQYSACLWIINSRTQQIRTSILESDPSEAKAISHYNKQLYIAGYTFPSPTIWITDLGGHVVRKIQPNLQNTFFETIEVINERIYVGARLFESLNPCIYEMDLNGTIINQWSLPVDPSYNGTISSLKVDGDKIYACGEQLGNLSNQAVVWLVNMSSNVVDKNVPLHSNTRNNALAVDVNETHVFISAHQDLKPLLLVLDKSCTLLTTTRLNSDDSDGKPGDLKLYNNKVYICGESLTVQNSKATLWVCDDAGNFLYKTVIETTPEPSRLYQLSIFKDTIYYAGWLNFAARSWKTNLQGADPSTFSLVKNPANYSFAYDLFIKESAYPSLEDSLQFFSPITYQR